MTADIADAGADLAEFDARHSQRGLYLRHARARTANFWPRQIVTGLGSASLAAFVSLETGMITLCLALVGEVIDCAALRHGQHLVDRDALFSRVVRLTSASAALQATTIALCVLIATTGENGQHTVFFGYAFLAGAAVNAGVFLSFHPPSSITRLVIYAATFLYLVANQTADAVIGDSTHALNLLGAPILALYGLLVCRLCPQKPSAEFYRRA